MTIGATRTACWHNGRKLPRATGRGRAARSFRLRLGASIAQAGRAAGGMIVPDGCIDLEWIDGACGSRARIERPRSTTGGRRDGGGVPFPPGRGRRVAGTAGVRNRRPPHPAGGVLGPDAAAWPKGRARRAISARAVRDPMRVAAARAIDSGASAGHARGVRSSSPDRGAARQSAHPLACRGARAERTHPAPALRRGIRLWTEDAQPHPAISSAFSNCCAARATARRRASPWKPAMLIRPISGAKPAGWRRRHPARSQRSSRIARAIALRTPGAPAAGPAPASDTAAPCRSLVSSGGVGYIAAHRPGLFAVATTERWQSGRSRRTRNAEYGQPYRGFESLPLRHRVRELA